TGASVDAGRSANWRGGAEQPAIREARIRPASGRRNMRNIRATLDWGTLPHSVTAGGMGCHVLGGKPFTSCTIMGHRSQDLSCLPLPVLSTLSPRRSAI